MNTQKRAKSLISLKFHEDIYHKKDWSINPKLPNKNKPKGNKIK